MAREARARLPRDRHRGAALSVLVDGAAAVEQAEAVERQAQEQPAEGQRVLVAVPVFWFLPDASLLQLQWAETPGQPVLQVPTNAGLPYSELTRVERGMKADKEYLRLFPSLNVGYNFTEQPVNNVRSPVDFDGDSKTDISIFRPGAGEWWYLKSSTGGNTALQFVLRDADS